jgi:hypothetical protein
MQANVDAVVSNELRQLRKSLVEKEEEGMLKKDELRQLRESMVERELLISQLRTLINVLHTP